MVPAVLRRGNRLLRQPIKGTTAPFSAVVLLVILSFLVLLMTFGNNGVKTDQLSVPAKWNSFDYVIKLDPTVEFRNGTNLIWQIPKSPMAVLFLAHGCNGRAANFWDKSPKCLNCVGLPEERLITLHALAKGFGVLVISSAERCWTFGKERVIVKDIIEWWIAKQKLEKLPLVALGASSGGYFVSALATDMRFSSIVLMISEGVFDKLDVTGNYPPTLFVHMPKDDVRKQRIDMHMEVLKQKGVAVAEIKCMPFPLSPSFLADRIPHVNATLSAKLFTLFVDKGYVDEEGYMVSDGRAIRWKPVLKEQNILFPDKSLVNHIQEEMNLAFAYHEMTSLPSEQIFDWFVSHLR